MLSPARPHGVSGCHIGCGHLRRASSRRAKKAIVHVPRKDASKHRVGVQRIDDAVRRVILIYAKSAAAYRAIIDSFSGLAIGGAREAEITTGRIIPSLQFATQCCCPFVDGRYPFVCAEQVAAAASAPPAGCYPSRLALIRDEIAIGLADLIHVPPLINLIAAYSVPPSRIFTVMEDYEPAGQMDETAVNVCMSAPHHCVVWREPAKDGRSYLLFTCANNGSIGCIDFATSEVSTFAGTRKASGARVGPRLAAQFHSPYALAVNRVDSSVLVTDDRVVRKIDASGYASILAGAYGAHAPSATQPVDGAGADARFGSLFGIACAESGAFAIVCDYGNGRLRRVDTQTGDVTSFSFVSATGAATHSIANLRTVAIRPHSNDEVCYAAGDNTTSVMVYNLATGAFAALALDIDELGVCALAFATPHLLIASVCNALYAVDMRTRECQLLTPNPATTATADSTTGGLDNMFGLCVSNGLAAGVELPLVYACEFYTEKVTGITLPADWNIFTTQP